MTRKRTIGWSTVREMAEAYLEAKKEFYEQSRHARLWRAIKAIRAGDVVGVHDRALVESVLKAETRRSYRPIRALNPGERERISELAPWGDFLSKRLRITRGHAADLILGGDHPSRDALVRAIARLRKKGTA